MDAKDRRIAELERECTCKLTSAPDVFPPTYDQRDCPTHGPSAPHYFIDHGMIHDRITGKHAPLEEVVELLNVTPDESRLLAWKTVIDIGQRWQETTKERDSAIARVKELEDKLALTESERRWVERTPNGEVRILCLTRIETVSNHVARALGAALIDAADIRAGRWKGK